GRLREFGAVFEQPFDELRGGEDRRRLAGVFAADDLGEVVTDGHFPRLLQVLAREVGRQQRGQRRRVGPAQGGRERLEAVLAQEEAVVFHLPEKFPLGFFQGQPGRLTLGR